MAEGVAHGGRLGCRAADLLSDLRPVGSVGGSGFACRDGDRFLCRGHERVDRCRWYDGLGSVGELVDELVCGGHDGTERDEHVGNETFASETSGEANVDAVSGRKAADHIVAEELRRCLVLGTRTTDAVVRFGELRLVHSDPEVADRYEVILADTADRDLDRR